MNTQGKVSARWWRGIKESIRETLDPPICHEQHGRCGARSLAADEPSDSASTVKHEGVKLCVHSGHKSVTHARRTVVSDAQTDESSHINRFQRHHRKILEAKTWAKENG